MSNRRVNGRLVDEVWVLGGGLDTSNDNTASGPISATGQSYRSTAVLTRPANIASYSARDVIGDVSGSAIITFNNIGPSGGTVHLQNCMITAETGTLPTNGSSGLRLWFFSSAPTAIADNQPWPCPTSDRAKMLNYVEMPAFTLFGDTILMKVDWTGIQLKLAPGSTSLFGLLQAPTDVWQFMEDSTVLEIRLDVYEVSR